MTSDQTMFIPDSPHPRVVVIGAGFAGINLCKHLRDKLFQVVLLDANNFHQFQPLLYQVATCGLEPDAIIFPIRKLFEKHDNLTFRMAEVTHIDLASNTIRTTQGHLSYDHLVLATGSTTNFFGNVELEQHALGMKNIREALNIRSLILQNLELAAASADPEVREACTNIVIVGGGPAGVETAGALAEFKSYILLKDYPDLDLDLMNIILIQSGDELLNAMSDTASGSSLDKLQRMGVQVVLNTRVTDYDGHHVATNTDRTFVARTLIWTAGVRGQTPAGLPEACHVRGNRICVDRHHRVGELQNVYAIGDIACMATENHPTGHPMVAQAAIQQGKHLADQLLAEQNNRPTSPFAYHDKGSLATIGKRKAVADLGRIRLTGFKAWLIWSFVHVVSLVGFRNRFMVFTNWMFSYFTYEKGNRFIVRRFDRRNGEELT